MAALTLADYDRLVLKPRIAELVARECDTPEKAEAMIEALRTLTAPGPLREAFIDYLATRLP